MPSRDYTWICRRGVLSVWKAMSFSDFMQSDLEPSTIKGALCKVGKSRRGALEQGILYLPPAQLNLMVKALH
jgi:hypothetical protein